MTEDLNELNKLIAEYRAARAQEKAKGAVFAAVVGKYFAALDDHRKAGEYRHSVGEKLLDALDVDAPQPVADTDAQAAIAEPVADAEFFLSQAAQSMERGDVAFAETLRADALEAALPSPEPVPAFSAAEPELWLTLAYDPEGEIDGDDRIGRYVVVNSAEEIDAFGATGITYAADEDTCVVALIGGDPSDEEIDVALARVKQEAAQAEPAPAEPEPVGQGALAPLSTLTMHVTAWGGDAEMVQTNYSFTEREEVDA